MRTAIRCTAIGPSSIRRASGAALRALPLLLCVRLLLPTPADAAGVTAGAAVWQWQNPAPTGNLLFDIEYLSAAVAWAVGAEGTCVRTLDGGVTWESAGPKTTRWLHALSFVDGQNGWVVGHDGTIFRTANGGDTWAKQNAGAGAPYLKGVDFVSPATGWAVGKGGVILHTADGGTTWSRQQTSTSANLEAVDFVSADRGWAVGDGGLILRTLDGGAHWKQQVSPLAGDLSDVSFFSAGSGCAAGPPGIVCTSDAGATWHTRYTKSDGYTQMDYMQGIVMLPGGYGWAVGEDAYRLSTTNGGLTWETQTYSGSALYAVDAISPSQVWAAGDGGAILSSTNGGLNWAALAADGDSSRQLNGVDFLSDGLTGWAVGYAGRIMHTVDAGENWTYQNKNVAGHLWAVDATTASEAWAVGDGGVVLHTTDGGLTWAEGTYSPTEFHSLVDVDFIEGPTTTGWAVGDSGTIARTDNGTTWVKQDAGTTGNLSSVSFVDADHGWVTGQGGVRRTTTGGVDPDAEGPLAGWELLPGAPGGNAVHFVNQQRGWVVGNAGLISRTTDGGATWTQQTWYNPGYTYPDFKGVWFADAQNGWIVGVPFGSIVLRTVNGGATWNQQSAGCSETLEDLVFADADHGWAVGWGGAILRLTGPLETTPPTTAVAGLSAWSNKNVTLRLAPSDAGTGPAWTWFKPAGLGWQTGRTLSILADPDYHSTDGVHRVTFFSTDNAGNREALRTIAAGIDTKRPWTQVLAPIAVAQGATATVRYRVNDPPPNGGTATATILIRNAAGALVKRIVRGGAPVNTNLQSGFVCTLPRGVYTVRVAATDAARNTQYDMISQTLTVN